MTKKKQAAPPPEDKRTPDERLAEHYTRELEWETTYRQKEVNKWAQEFASDPYYSLSHSQAIVNTSARLKVYTDLAKMVKHLTEELVEEPKRTLRQALTEYKAHLDEQVFRKAKWPEHSTDPTSNFASQCLTSAMAELTERLGQVLKLYS